MAKPNIKALAANHFEKAIFGLLCAFALFTLVMTRWVPYGHEPREITEKVKQADTIIESKTWPQEEQQTFVVPKPQTIEALVANNILRQVDATPYEFDLPFTVGLYHTTKPIVEPDYLSIRGLIADGGRFLMAAIPDDETILADGDADSAMDAESDDAEDDQSDIPEEFRTRNTLRPAGGGLAGSPGGPGASGGGFADEYAAEMEAQMSAQMQGGMGGPGGGGFGGGEEYGDYGAMGGGGGGAYGAAGGAEGRGLRYVAVRGIIPLREQIQKFRKAMNIRSFSAAAAQFEIIDFELQRKKMQPGDEPWGGEWEPVDIQIALDMLGEAIAFDPEVVQGSITDSAVTMPLPQRLMGIWKSKATHPQLENFTLSPDDMEKELEFNRLLIEKYEEDKQNIPEERVAKKGFSGVAYDSRSMQSSAFDMGYGGMGEGMEEEMSGMGDYGGFGGSGATGINYAPTSQTAMTPEAKAFLDKLKKEVGNSKEDQDKALLEYITERITAQGELLLFRYFDFDVEPGATYQYRARLEIRNPNYGLSVAQVGGIVEIVEGQTRKSDWSNKTEPAFVPHDVDYFVARINEPNGYSRPEARMALFQWNPDLGTTVADSVEVSYGEEIGGPKTPLVLDPAKNSFEFEQYTFHTGDVLVDALLEQKIDKRNHPDLNLPRKAKSFLGISGQVLISKGNEELAVIDHFSRLSALKDRRKTLEYEQQPYEDIKNKQNAAADVNALDMFGSSDYGGFGGGEYSADEGMGSGGYGAFGGGGGNPFGGAEDYGRGGGRQRSSLRKRRR